MRLSKTAAERIRPLPFDLEDRFPVVAYFGSAIPGGKGGCRLRCPACAAGDVDPGVLEYADNGAMQGQVCDECELPIDRLIAAARIAAKWDGCGVPPDLSVYTL